MMSHLPTNECAMICPNRSLATCWDKTRGGTARQHSMAMPNLDGRRFEIETAPGDTVTLRHHGQIFVKTLSGKTTSLDISAIHHASLRFFEMAPVDGEPDMIDAQHPAAPASTEEHPNLREDAPEVTTRSKRAEKSARRRCRRRNVQDQEDIPPEFSAAPQVFDMTIHDDKHATEDGCFDDTIVPDTFDNSSDYNIQMESDAQQNPIATESNASICDGCDDGKVLPILFMNGSELMQHAQGLDGDSSDYSNQRDYDAKQTPTAVESKVSDGDGCDDGGSSGANVGSHDHDPDADGPENVLPIQYMNGSEVVPHAQRYNIQSDSEGKPNPIAVASNVSDCDECDGKDDGGTHGGEANSTGKYEDDGADCDIGTVDVQRCASSDRNVAFVAGVAVDAHAKLKALDEELQVEQVLLDVARSFLPHAQEECQKREQAIAELRRRRCTITSSFSNFSNSEGSFIDCDENHVIHFDGD